MSQLFSGGEKTGRIETAPTLSVAFLTDVDPACGDPRTSPVSPCFLRKNLLGEDVGGPTDEAQVEPLRRGKTRRDESQSPAPNDHTQDEAQLTGFIRSGMGRKRNLRCSVQSRKPFMYCWPFSV